MQERQGEGSIITVGICGKRAGSLRAQTLFAKFFFLLPRHYAHFIGPILYLLPLRLSYFLLGRFHGLA